MFDEAVLKTAGVIDAVVTHPTTKHRERMTFYVATVHKQPLIDKDACIAFDLITVNEDNICSVTRDNSRIITTERILDEYADLFQGIGLLNGNVHLETDPTTPSVRMPLESCRFLSRTELLLS